MYLTTPRVITYDASVGTLKLDSPTSLPDDPSATLRYPSGWELTCNFSPYSISCIDSPDGRLSFPVQAPRVRSLFSGVGAFTGWDIGNADWSEAGWQPDTVALTGEYVRVTASVIRSGDPTDTDPEPVFEGLLTIFLPRSLIIAEEVECAP